MGYAHTQQHLNSPRFLGFFAALAVNVLLIFGLSNGLRFRDVPVSPPPIDVFPVPAKVQRTPPPIPQPVDPDAWAVDKPELPVPYTEIDVARDAPVSQAGTLERRAAGGTQGAGPSIVPLQVDSAHFVPPAYPRISIAANEQGVVQLLIYVLPDGSVGDVRIRKSSGYPRLDNAAVKTAKARWRFRPRMEDGTPIAAWGTYAVRFRLD